MLMCIMYMSGCIHVCVDVHVETCAYLSLSVELDGCDSCCVLLSESRSWKRRSQRSMMNFTQECKRHAVRALCNASKLSITHGHLSNARQCRMEGCLSNP